MTNKLTKTIFAVLELTKGLALFYYIITTTTFVYCQRPIPISNSTTYKNISDNSITPFYKSPSLSSSSSTNVGKSILRSGQHIFTTTSSTIQPYTERFDINDKKLNRNRPFTTTRRPSTQFRPRPPYNKTKNNIVPPKSAKGSFNSLRNKLKSEQPPQGTLKLNDNEISPNNIISRPGNFNNNYNNNNFNNNYNNNNFNINNNINNINNTNRSKTSSGTIIKTDTEVMADSARTDRTEDYNDRGPYSRVNRIIKNNSYVDDSYLSNSNYFDDRLGVKCTFDTDCAWKWSQNSTNPDSVYVTNGVELTNINLTGLYPGPKADPFDDGNGKFLYIRLHPDMSNITLTSPIFSNTLENCQLELSMHQSNMFHGLSRIVIQPTKDGESPWVISEIVGNDLNIWEPKYYKIGRVQRDFRILLEIVPPDALKNRAHVAIDNLRMVGCFKDSAKNRNCSTTQLKCTSNKVPVCIDLESICDIDQDCDYNEDESLNCDKIPYGGRCDFEADWCGWKNGAKNMLLWSRHTGPSPTDKTGPDSDHTFQHMSNSSGYYMLVNMNQSQKDPDHKIGFASNAIMNSKIFNPPPSLHGNPSSPYRNSCMVRFNVHQYGLNAGSINFSVVEIKETENITTTLWWSFKNRGEMWHRQIHILPNITTRYFLQFEARMGMRIFSDVAVDDVSLSPECFGINIPEDQLDGYDYWNPRLRVRKNPHKDFFKKPYFELTTCGARGLQGPTASQCENIYKEINNSYILDHVKILETDNYKGMQKWKVPNEGYYTVIAKGAGGGLSSNGVGSSRGATSIAVLELHKNEEIYISVGQKGENACPATLGESDCVRNISNFHDLTGYPSKTHMVKNYVFDTAAGGGGGGTFIFLINSGSSDSIPLIIAGGGGGLGFGRYIDADVQHGQGFEPDRKNVTGLSYTDGNRTAGPGGGWKARDDTALGPTFGASLLEGARGGYACYSTNSVHGQGGFGGGGGGCMTGGGGGGFSGGNSYGGEPINGEGGSSFINPTRSLNSFSYILPAENTGHGSVIIIPAIEGCGCDYRCIALDEYRSVTKCICPDKWKLKPDNDTSCEMIGEDEFEIPIEYLVIFFCVITVFLAVALTLLLFILYNRYQRKKQAAERHKMLQDQDLQLSRLRHNADDSALTNFNPNYGCDGILNGNIDIKSLPQVARESLRLVKALGQGAFGEVYQGLYRHRDGDAVEMPVAVKTLPEMSTGQAEADFLMEAAIMAKFNHPNIVHLIGVCFDRHPRFIVLELLAGGDLKNFLREGRNKPERPSPLSMKDLVFCALDVAKGCRYMESKRFIHRDIAARNCLLSSKGPGRVVKIADFGMARDIYRSDYYRKGGKAMLPIKWMPPEAFLDGIFTSKTDVWSFGVLLWEVFSLGLMPYTGLPNRDVMQLVTGGGRLDAPSGCPSVIYTIMAECWDPTPEDRPTFEVLLNKLTTCTQDLEIMNAPLPSIFRPPSSERDQTVMRPAMSEDICLQIPSSSDYLVPLQTSRTLNGILQESSGITMSSDTLTTSTVVNSTSSLLTRSCSLECDDNMDQSWETSFTMSNNHINNNNNNINNNNNNNNDQMTTQANTNNKHSPTQHYYKHHINNDTKLMNGRKPTGLNNIVNGQHNYQHQHPMHHHHHNHNHSHQNHYTHHPSTTSSSSHCNTTGHPTSITTTLTTAPGQQQQQQNIAPTTNGYCTTANCNNKQPILTSTSCGVCDEETRLISLDTPQPTPTSIKSHISFSQLDGITLDPTALEKCANNTDLSSTVLHIIPSQPYANIQTNNIRNNMHNNKTVSVTTNTGSLGGSGGGVSCVGIQNGSLNGTTNGSIGNGSANGSSVGGINGQHNGSLDMKNSELLNGNNCNSSINSNSVPFTIQAFNDRFINSDNHSEITC